MELEKNNLDNLFIKISEKGYPTQEGKYLVKFLDEENNMKLDYQVLFYREVDENKFKFFLDKDCPECAGFEGPVFKNKVLEYIFLPPLN